MMASLHPCPPLPRPKREGGAGPNAMQRGGGGWEGVTEGGPGEGGRERQRERNMPGPEEVGLQRVEGGGLVWFGLVRSQVSAGLS